MRFRRTLFPFLLTCSLFSTGQEVKYIDLMGVQQRTELRSPPAPPPECQDDTHCSGSGGVGGIGIACGGPNRRDPHALGVYLERVTPTEIDPAEPFEVEFRVLNTGLAPIELPVRPHLSDLQPGNEWAQFTYLSLELIISPTLSSDPQDFASVKLYGSTEHDESTLVLKPGEWLRVCADVKLQSRSSKAGFAQLRGAFSLQRNTFYPHAGGSFTMVDNLYPNATPTPSVDIHWLASESSKH
jgi:hypothetical protein